MAKPLSYYVCSNCGKRSTAFMGRCPQCSEFGTMEQVIEQPAAPPSVNPRSAIRSSAGGMRVAPRRLAEVESGEDARMPVAVEEFSRVMGGGIVPGSITLIAGEPGIGKCLVGSTRVFDPLTGDYLPITEWTNSRHHVLSMSEDTFRLSCDQSVAFHENGIQPIVEVRTKLGRTLRCTLNHPVYTPEGWQPVEALVSGSYIAAPRELPYFGSENMPDEEVKIIAYILSDGSAQSDTTVTTCLPEVVEDLHRIAEFFGLALRTYTKNNNKASTYKFVTHTGRRQTARTELAQALHAAKKQSGISWAEWSRRADVNDASFKKWRRGKCVPNEVMWRRLASAVPIDGELLALSARSAAEMRTPIARLLEQHGVRYKRANNKSVPDCIFRLPKQQLALFLKTLFTCDGSVYVNSKNTPGLSYTTISKRLAEDVQHLLLRFGLITTLRTKPMQVNSQPYTAYEVTLLGIEEMQRFISEIGIMGRHEAVQITQNLEVPAGPSTHRDMVPLTKEFWQRLNENRQGMSYVRLSDAIGTTIANRRHERPLCRSTVQKLSTYFKDPYFERLADNDLDWDQIVSITPAGEEPVYDISVKAHHNFVANDLIVHNSTLLVQISTVLAQTLGKVLYVSGEESARQIKMRADRLSLKAEDLFLVTETSLEAILDDIQTLDPKIVIIDSIQTTFSDDKPSAAGTVTQVRECAARLQMLAKSTGIAIFLVGHVTKEGTIAGPRVLEHIVDTVLYLEGDPFHTYRLLRSVKNRFGATSEVGVFEMRGSGLVEVTNPSEVFLAERVMNAPGSGILVTMEGTRPLLVEVQALASPTAYPNPRRTANGVDTNRLQLLSAVLSRRVGLRLAEQDIFVNVIGGLTVDEPAADLAVAATIASSYWDAPIPPDLVLVGEIGLSGELRAVGQLGTRLKEAAKLGFKRALVPKTARTDESLPKGIQTLAVRSLYEALAIAIPRNEKEKA